MRLARVLAVLEPGGAQLGVLRLTRALAARGISSRVLAGEATAAGRALFAAEGVAVEVWGGEHGLQYACSPGFAAWLAPRLGEADLVHAHMFGGWWAAAGAAPPEMPLVASEHNALRWPGRARTAAYSRALRRVDGFLAHGPATAELASGLGLPAARLHVGTSPVEDVARARPRAPGRVVFAGRLHHEKGADVLIEALAHLSDPPPAAIVGSGPEEEALRALVAERGLSERVAFPGWQDRVAPWLAEATACVVPSRHEAWSQTAVLALALGVPVIASDVEGLPTTLADGRGVLVAPEDPAALATALARVLAGDHPSPAPGRVYAGRFTTDRIAAAHARLYAELLAARLPAAA